MNYFTLRSNKQRREMKHHMKVKKNRNKKYLFTFFYIDKSLKKKEGEKRKRKTTKLVYVDKGSSPDKKFFFCKL